MFENPGSDGDLNKGRRKERVLTFIEPGRYSVHQVALVVLLSWQILIGWESIASLSDFVTSRAQVKSRGQFPRFFWVCCLGPLIVYGRLTANSTLESNN